MEPSAGTESQQTGAPAQESEPEPATDMPSTQESTEGGDAPEPAPAQKKEGFFARKKREFAEYLARKSMEAKQAEERENAKAGVMKADYLQPSFDTALKASKGTELLNRPK